MKLFFIYPEEIVIKRAREVSVLNTFNELKKICDAKLVVAGLNESIERLNDFFQIDLNKDDLIILDKNFLFLKSTKIFNKKLKAIIDEYEDGAVFYTRHLKVANFLIKNKTKNQSVFFEVHESFYLNSNDKAVLELERDVIKNSNGVVFTNHSSKKEFYEMYKDTKQSVVIHNSTSCVKNVKFKKFKVNEIAYFGSFLPWKGLSLIKNVLRDFFTLKFFIYGDDSSPEALEFKSSVINESYFNRIKFLGFIHQREVISKLEVNQKILVILNTPSVYENFSTPLKLFEYLSTYNVVVAPDFAPIKEIIKDKKNGFLYKGGDEEDLKRVLGYVFEQSNEFLNEIATNALFDMKEFTYKKRAQKIIKFIYRVNSIK